jgi:hypothetical protein
MVSCWGLGATGTTRMVLNFLCPLRVGDLKIFIGLRLAARR